MNSQNIPRKTGENAESPHRNMEVTKVLVLYGDFIVKRFGPQTAILRLVYALLRLWRFPGALAIPAIDCCP